MSKAFDFGANWKSFSTLALDEEKYADAEKSLKELFGREHFIGLSFLDIGCGSGIFSVAAKKLGAQKVTGMDISPNSVEASKQNAERFGLAPEEYHFFQGDILKADILPQLGKHDLVYSWGCLHHTGRMWLAIDHTLACVKPGGQLVLAIYNRHASSLFWKVVKKVYMHSPQFLKTALVWIFYGPIYISKWFLTRQNPMQMKRGMDFYHDIVDWVGGYPYEYASAEQIIEYVEKRGFSLSKLWRTDLLVGNNQFLFERVGA